MTTDIAIRDDMKAVDRWENEGGKVPSFNNVWASLKRFTAEDNSGDKRMIYTQKSLGRQPGLFSRFDLGGWSSET
jgi:hypothetical protein